VWEKYCTAGFNKDHIQTFQGDGGFSVASIWPMVRNFEGKFDLDKLSFCPELKLLEKRARNMTARNLMSWRVGRPLENAPYATESKPKNLYDVPKMQWVVADKANYAAVVPSSYGAGTVPLEWSKQHYASQGTTVLLQRELRYTFPAGSEGFTEYAAYPWTHLFSQMAARSFTIEADASGTFLGHHGIFANARDFLKLGITMVQQGKWFGKQLYAAEHIERNLNNPFGSDQWFAEGWHTYQFSYGGVPRVLYLIGDHGGIFLCPELEIAVFDFQNGHNPKRSETLIFYHLHMFLISQTRAWSTTTTTGITSTMATTTSTTAVPGVTSAVDASVSKNNMSTTHKDTSKGEENLPTSFTTRSCSPWWTHLLLMFTFQAVVQSAK